VYARSTAANHYALVASSSTGQAGLLQGDVLIQGNLVVLGTQSSAAPAAAAPGAQADSAARTTYQYVQSPQGWIEDAGEGRLVDGRAAVPLAPELARAIDPARYHVFLTPHSPETETLAVVARLADRFEVVEHGKGASTATFSYRIMAQRRATPGASADRLPAPQLPGSPPAPKPVDLIIPPPPETPGRTSPPGR
jgi:hypothetical protein